MKRSLIILATFLLTSSLAIDAQSMYKTVMDKATGIVNNPSASNEQKQISQFQIAALKYISSQANSKDDYFFDSQAVNLVAFTDEYFVSLKAASNISNLKRQEVQRIYTTATKSNPLFNDGNKAVTEKYINDSQSITPFCIDTNWEKAYDQVSSQIKNILKK